jgi:hypothetical protein
MMMEEFEIQKKKGCECVNKESKEKVNEFETIFVHDLYIFATFCWAIYTST